MSVQVRRRREASSFLASFVGAQGELIVDTTNNRVQVHDGATPGGFAAAKLSEVVTNTRTSVADVSYAALPSDRTIACTAITAPRIVTLPPASAYPTGTPLLVVDESGASSSANTITLARAGSDLINGAASATIASAFGFIAIVSNGVSRWTIIDQSAGAAASTATITSGTIDGTSIGSTTRSSGAFTTLAVTSSISLPSNSVANAALAQMPSLTLKANTTGAAATPVDASLSAIIDASQGSTRGAVLFRGSSGWTALVPGTAGTVLTSNGAGADPAYQPGGGAAAMSVPVRQTVMSGPSSAGAPGFLPATAPSLVLSTQGVSSSVPLILTAAQGHGATGASNVVFQFTSNTSWTLVASATNFLYVNVQTGATGVSASQPIYQFGGAVATTNGQFTFDYQAMIGYLGNGTTAVTTPLVFVGEAVTSASAVTSTLPYAFNARASVLQPTLTTSAAYTLPHNVGVPQLIVRGFLQCKTAELGFAVNDRTYDTFYQGSASSVYGTAFQSSSKNLFVSTMNAAVGALGKGGFVIGGFTSANWAAGGEILRAW